jgi:hypothetical protein
MTGTSKQILATAYTDASGNAAFDIGAGVTDSLMLTVTAHNCVPYLGVIHAKAAGAAADPGAATRPVVFGLNAVWPNPFTDRTRITFGLPAPARATLAIYNVAGQRVATLVDGVLAAGGHFVSWDGRAANGARAASGCYFCCLSAAGRQAIRRMVYVR